MNNTNEGSKLYLYSITSVAILGGLLFGYDTAVISGAEKGLEAFFLTATDFQYDKVMHGITSSSALIGCVQRQPSEQNRVGENCHNNVIEKEINDIKDYKCNLHSFFHKRSTPFFINFPGYILIQGIDNEKIENKYAIDFSFSVTK